MSDDAFRADQAYSVIRRAIVSCGIMPGARFTEAELMARFALGKSSVRIALRRLIERGFVTSIPRHGYRVTPVTVRDVEEVFALRLALEPLAARLAAGRVDRALLEELEAACRREAPGDVDDQIEQFLEANRSFHMAIAMASGNQRLCRTLSGLLDEMTRLVALGFGAHGVRPNIENDHTSLIEHLAADDPDAAETVARRHVETFRAMTMEKVLASLPHAALAPQPVERAPRARVA
ncbi:GntR family transcriptional regulator [Chelatococcus sambhunathii]|uniref:GntR family transcriptional regulator n=1 Tax=Chelatococcus sambhunathii TaxID=363953 RepID=A0ABU1DIN6_9HYPH|nr:GntR family transcriptional regulator [Chelatococcus sambhunathii]MDR4307991.1 GntR family transcriptional regulator [Chelatococcus sambhunathii]